MNEQPTHVILYHSSFCVENGLSGNKGGRKDHIRGHGSNLVKEWWWQWEGRKIGFSCVQLTGFSDGLERQKAVAPHSSTLAWKIPWTEEPGGLPSMGSHRVGHNWSDLTASAERQRGSQWAWAAGRTSVAAIGKVEGSSVVIKNREIWNSV